MTLPQFHSGLRALLNIDRHDLVAAGVFDAADATEWVRFRDDPFRWFIRAPDAKAEKLWALVQGRVLV
jgi:hypothetical protein